MVIHQTLSPLSGDQHHGAKSEDHGGGLINMSLLSSFPVVKILKVIIYKGFSSFSLLENNNLACRVGVMYSTDSNLHGLLSSFAILR